jgi:hypothetical protein
MLESIDVYNKPSPNENKMITYLFILVSFSYMLPFIATSGLISYYSSKYGMGFFVFLNFAYYGTGLPVSYLQKNLDKYYDTIYSSKYTFRKRVYLAMWVSIIFIIASPFAGEMALLFMTVGIGFCTWSCHGGVSAVTSIIKGNTNIMQQIGFVLPGISTIILLRLFRLREDDVDDDEIFIYYIITGILVLPGLLAWVNHPYNNIK